MKLITRDTDYAIRALVCIAGGDKKVVNVRALSEKLNIPRAFLRKILQMLNKAGILKSCKGKGGGFSLVVRVEKISMLSIVEIFQGPFNISEHVFKGKACPRINTCLLKKEVDGIGISAEKKLKSITIASLIKKQKR